MPFHQEKFFFDYPLVDANAIACSALRVIYHGSCHGSFATAAAKRPPLDLHQIDAFKISLTHLSEDPLTEGYSYSLVYLNAALSAAIWEGKNRDNTPDLMHITRRVLLAASPSLNAKRYRTPFWVKFQKPIYLARYDAPIDADHSVPDTYLQTFYSKYQGFLMRTKEGYPLVRNTLEASGLKLLERKMVLDPLNGDMQVLSYRS